MNRSPTTLPDHMTCLGSSLPARRLGNTSNRMGDTVRNYSYRPAACPALTGTLGEGPRINARHKGQSDQPWRLPVL